MRTIRPAISMPNLDSLEIEHYLAQHLEGDKAKDILDNVYSLIRNWSYDQTLLIQVGNCTLCSRPISLKDIEAGYCTCGGTIDIKVWKTEREERG